MLFSALPYFLRPGTWSSSFFIICQKHSRSGKFGRLEKSWCKTFQYNSFAQLWLMKTSSPTVSHTQLYSLCVEPIGEREAGDSRPTWPSSMECFLFRDWLLAGGGVGHLSRPLVVCELYGLPNEKRGVEIFHKQGELNRSGSGNFTLSMSHGIALYSLVWAGICAFCFFDF